MTGVYCTNGHPMGPGERFCGTCGAAAMAGGPAPGYQPAAQPATPGGMNPIIWVVVAVIVAAAGIVIALVATGGDDDGGTTLADSSLPPASQPTVVSPSSSSTSSSMPATSSTSTSSTATTSSTTTTTTIPGPDTLMTASWDMATGGDLGGEGGQDLYDIAVAADGTYVALGLDGFTGVWTSPDALTWTQQPLGAEFNGTQMTHVEQAPDGTLVAVGRRLGEPHRFAAWTSPDGLTWTQQPPATGDLPGGHQGVVDFEAHPGGFVAVGAAQDGAGDSDAAWWTSLDGVTWTAGTIPEAGTQMMAGVAVGNGVMVAAGQHGQEVGAWRAPIGDPFVRVTDPDLTLAVDDPDPAYADPQVFAWDVAATGPGFVAVGGSRMQAGVVAAAVWTSVDGTDWVRYGNETGYQPNMLRANFAGTTWSVMDTVLDSNGTTVVLGRSGTPVNPNLTVWQSSDGHIWEHGPIGVRDLGQRAHRAIAMDGKIIVVGGDGAADGTGDGAVWVATGDPSAPAMGTWREVPRFDTSTEGWINGAVVSDGRIVGAGHGPFSSLWVSANGVTWSEYLRGSAPQTTLTDIVEISGTYYVCGRKSEGGIWWSTDLETWQQATLPAGSDGWTDGIRQANGQAVAYGRDFDDNPFLWVSGDGRTWTDTAVLQQIGVGNWIVGVAQHGNYAVMVTIDNSSALGVWVSTDNRTWTRQEDDPLFTGFGPEEIASFDGTVVIAGNAPNRGGNVAAVLTSQDFLSWTLTPLAGEAVAIDAWIFGLSSSDSRLFITGQHNPNGVDWLPVVWSTADLSFWIESFMLPAAGGPNDQFGLPGTVYGVVEHGGRWVAVGERVLPEGWDAAAWTSDNP